jgi:hypothetical protein
MPQPEPTPLWAQRPDEPIERYEAFLAYRAMGLHRTQKALAEKIGVSSKSITRWADEHDWAARLAAWEAVVEAARSEARIDAQAVEAAKWEARRLADCEDAYAIAVKLKEVVNMMLRHPMTRKKVTSRYEDGREKTVIIEPAKWNVASLTRAAKMVQDLAEAARSSALEDDLDGFDEENATPEECVRVINAHKAKRAAFRRIKGDAGGVEP